MASGYFWILMDALAIIALFVWLGLNLWLWASDLSQEKMFVRSMLLAIPGYAGFFGYLAYRGRDRSL
jgi:hypothetical protein